MVVTGSIILTTSLISLVVSLIVYMIQRYMFAPKFKIEGKTVLITGGSSGIGKALAIYAIKHGAKAVYIVARNQKMLDEAKEEISSYSTNSNQKVFTFSCDVTNLDQVKNLARALEGDENYPTMKCSSLDFIFINQGNAEPGYFLEQEPEIFKRMIDVNYLGGVYLSKYLVPIMMRLRKSSENSKHIVFVSSAAGIFSMIGYSSYCPAKHAIRSFAECLNTEISGKDIYVHCSLPPDTQTPGFDKENLTKPPETKILSEVAGLAKPEDIAHSLFSQMASGRFLLSEDFIVRMLYSITRGVSAFIPLLFVDWVLTSFVAFFAPLFRFYFWLIPYRMREEREVRFLNVIGQIQQQTQSE